MTTKPSNPRLDEASKATRHYLVAVALFSLAINLLYLASPLYMMQVYNRIVTSGSVITLMLLTVMLVVALLALSSLDIVRGWIMSRMGLRLDQILAPRIFAASFRVTGASGAQPLRDFETFRQFLSSGVIFALFDVPWVPIYILAAFLLHFWFGVFTIACCLILLTLALVNEWQLVKPLREANEAMQRSHSFAESSLRNAEVVQAMGMMDGITRRWQRDRDVQTEKQARAATWAVSATGTVRFFRLAMQSLVLGLGAWLTIEHQVSAGAMFAATFLLGRALQPVEQIVGAWRQVVTARLAYIRVRDVLATAQLDADLMTLPRPKGALAVENLHFTLPGTSKLILRNISFQIQPGECIGVVGPSGAGKSSLMRLLVGVLKPSAGIVRLDGADLQTWPRDQLGAAIGYLPQDVELFADTVSANISRFQGGSDDKVFKAAESAGVHDMILRLPQGYNTPIGPSGETLSGGYRQRVGLARAVYDSPSLVVLDEPSSNLDGEGDFALARCLQRLKQLGITVVIVSHRPATLAAVDKIMVLKDGLVEAFGPRDEVAAKLQPPRVIAQDRARDPVNG